MQIDDEASGVVDPAPSTAVYLTEEEKLAKAKEVSEANYWLNAVVVTSKQEADPWVKECKDAWREYQGQKTDGTWRPTRLWWAEVYPRYWSDTELMCPALYSRTPKAVSRRKFDSPDPIAKTATVINDRFAAWLMQTGNFDECMEMCALGFLNTNRQTCRLFYEEKVTQRKERVFLSEMPSEDGQMLLVDENGDTPPDDVAILTDEVGAPYWEKETDEEVVKPRVIVRPVQFDKIKISPGARNVNEIWWIAYENTVTRKQAAELFGDKIKHIKDGNPSDLTDVNFNTDDRIKRSSDLFTYIEVWNKRDREVYWLHSSYKRGFLKKEKDIYGLINFYPSPSFLIDNTRFDSCYPTPDYTQCKDAYEQCHILYKRINQATRVLKACLLFDGSEPDLQNFFSELRDNQGIGVSKWAEDISQGGFANKIFIPDYTPIVRVLEQLRMAFDSQKVAIDELRGITDLIRGASEPTTSATAEKIKDRRSTLRFAKKKKSMLKFATETLQMMLDLAYKTFDESYIKEIVGFNQMIPEDQQRFGAALAILKDDEERVIRIDIETDSMVLFDDMDRKEQAMQALEVTGQYINQISTANPVFTPALVALLGKVIRTMDDARDAEDPVFQAFQQLAQQALQPPQPPQPNPDLMAQLQAQQQIEMAKLQSNQQLKVMELQSNQQIEMAKLQNSQGKDIANLQLETQKTFKELEQGDVDLMIKSEANQLKREAIMGDLTKEQMRNQTSIDMKSTDQMLKARESQSRQALEAARLEIERALASIKEYEITMREQEKWITEMRLQQESKHQQELDAASLMKDLEVDSVKEQTKQIEAMAKAQSAPQIVNITGGNVDDSV